MKKSICLYFQVHQPTRLRLYRFFDIGKDSHYYDDFANRTILKRIAQKCYLPMNQVLLDAINESGGAFKVAFSITGSALEQFDRYAPEVIDSFRALAQTGCVEFLGETYYHSLASLTSPAEFKHQVLKHQAAIEEYFGVKPVSREGTERLVRAACQYALDHGRPSVTLVHKGNIMKYTEGGFRKWGYELVEREFGDAVADGRLVVNDCICDAFLQNALLRPEDYSVIATLNLNGDYVSDMLAAQVGGIGISPGANINYQTGVAVFEATHGTAPKYANLDKVNPGSLILSGEMMLRYMGWTEAADKIIAAMDKVIAAKTVTYDFARQMEGATEVKCSEFGNALAAAM